MLRRVVAPLCCALVAVDALPTRGGGARGGGDTAGGPGPGGALEEAPPPPPHGASPDPYEPGGHAVVVEDVPAGEGGAPRPSRVVRPAEPGTYPTLVLHHGFTLTPADYTSLMTHVASHGYIAVAPLLYRFPWVPSVADEAAAAAEVHRWATGGCPGLPPAAGVEAARRPPVVAGHSRGGMVAWAAAAVGAVSGVAGMDPVDVGAGRRGSVLQPDPSAPQMVRPGAFNLQVPSLVVGCGQSGGCAPEGRSYKQFWAQSIAPRALVVLDGAGHMGVLDDGAAWVQSLACKAGAMGRGEVRRAVGGALVLHLRACEAAGARAAMAATDPLIST